MTKPDKRKMPLRKVVDYGKTDLGLPTETLECGHVIRTPQDVYGYTNAARRRCRQCAEKRMSA